MEKILVVVDMQNDFIDGALGSKEAQSIVSKVKEKIEAYKAEGYRIYFTQDTHTIEYLQTQEGKHLPVEHCIRGTEGWELEPTIAVLQRALSNETHEGYIFEKGVFGSEALANYLRKSLQESDEVMIELVGLCTDICVLANAVLLKTYLPRDTIQVDAACCAGVTPVSHNNALEAMKMCHIHIINQ